MHETRIFFEHTTIHGIKDFTSIKTKPIRFIWAVFVGLCMGIMVYEMRLITMEYMQTPTASQMIQNSSQFYDYPRILFCPKNWINSTEVFRLGISEPLLLYALSLLPDLFLNSDEKAAMVANYSQLSGLGTELEKFLEDSNFADYSDFFLSIAKNATFISTCYNCKSARHNLISSGVCVSLYLYPASAAQLIQSTRSFRFIDSQPNPKHEQLLPLYSSAYTTDLLHISHRMTQDFFCYDPILLNRNFSYILRITPVLYKRVDRPSRQCVGKAEKSKYSQSDCYIQCNKARKRQCQHCRFLDNQNGVLTKGAVQGNATKPYCSTLTNASYLPGNCAKGDQQFDECIMSCLPLCNEWVYETTVIPISQRKLYAGEEEADISISFSYQVRYGETVIVEVSMYTWDRFVSNVGGQLGLWLGASVVSLVQLVQFFIRFVYVKCRQYGESELSRMEAGKRDSDKRMQEKPTVIAVNEQSNSFELDKHF